MKQFLFVIVALAAGFGGAFAFQQFGPATSGDGAGDGADASLLRERMADLERRLDAVGEPSPSLRTAGAAPGTGAAADADAVVTAVLAKLDERVDERVTEKFESLQAEAGSANETPGGSFRARRKRMKLEDAARELELSAGEEDELRRIYKDTMDRMLKLAAGENGDVEAVKRDLEAARANPATGQALMMKYLPNMMKNMGEVIAITTEREAAVVKAIGPDKARRLNSEFDVVEANPIGGGFRVGASVEREMPDGR